MGGFYRINQMFLKTRASRILGLMFAASLLSYCEPEVSVSQNIPDEVVDPMATDFFFMRNPEIREDLLEQLVINEVDHWINADDSIGFFVQDTREVDRIANESIAVWITSQ